MDYHTLKRKELQSLCKKHGIPANLKNVEMASRLSALFNNKEEKPENGAKRGRSCLKNSEVVELVGDEEKEVKKVRFSPENQTFLFERTDPRAARLWARKRRTLVNSGKEDLPNLVRENVEESVVVSGDLRRVSEDVVRVEEPVRRNTRRKSVARPKQVVVCETVDGENVKRNLRARGKKAKEDNSKVISLLSPCVDKAKSGRKGQGRKNLGGSEGVNKQLEKEDVPILVSENVEESQVESGNFMKVSEDVGRVEEPVRRNTMRKSVAQPKQVVVCETVDDGENVKRNLKARGRKANEGNKEVVSLLSPGVDKAKSGRKGQGRKKFGGSEGFNNHPEKMDDDGGNGGMVTRKQVRSRDLAVDNEVKGKVCEGNNVSKRARSGKSLVSKGKESNVVCDKEVLNLSEKPCEIVPCLPASSHQDAHECHLGTGAIEDKAENVGEVTPYSPNRSEHLVAMSNMTDAEENRERNHSIEKVPVTAEVNLQTLRNDERPTPLMQNSGFGEANNVHQMHLELFNVADHNSEEEPVSTPLTGTLNASFCSMEEQNAPGITEENAELLEEATQLSPNTSPQLFVEHVTRQGEDNKETMGSIENAPENVESNIQTSSKAVSYTPNLMQVEDYNVAKGSVKKAPENSDVNIETLAKTVSSTPNSMQSSGHWEYAQESPGESLVVPDHVSQEDAFNPPSILKGTLNSTSDSSILEQNSLDASEPVCGSTGKCTMTESSAATNVGKEQPSCSFSDFDCGVNDSDISESNEGLEMYQFRGNARLIKEENKSEELPCLSKMSQTEDATGNELLDAAAVVVHEIDGLMEQEEIAGSRETFSIIHREAEHKISDTSSDHGSEFVLEEKDVVSPEASIKVNVQSPSAVEDSTIQRSFDTTFHSTSEARAEDTKTVMPLLSQAVDCSSIKSMLRPDPTVNTSLQSEVDGDFLVCSNSEDNNKASYEETPSGDVACSTEPDEQNLAVEDYMISSCQINDLESDKVPVVTEENVLTLNNDGGHCILFQKAYAKNTSATEINSVGNEVSECLSVSDSKSCFNQSSAKAAEPIEEDLYNCEDNNANSIHKQETESAKALHLGNAHSVTFETEVGLDLYPLRRNCELAKDESGPGKLPSLSKVSQNDNAIGNELSDDAAVIVEPGDVQLMEQENTAGARRICDSIDRESRKTTPGTSFAQESNGFIAEETLLVAPKGSTKANIQSRSMLEDCTLPKASAEAFHKIWEVAEDMKTVMQLLSQAVDSSRIKSISSTLSDLTVNISSLQMQDDGEQMDLSRSAKKGEVSFEETPSGKVGWHTEPDLQNIATKDHMISSCQIKDLDDSEKAITVIEDNVLTLGNTNTVHMQETESAEASYPDKLESYLGDDDRNAVLINMSVKSKEMDMREDSNVQRASPVTPQEKSTDRLCDLLDNYFAQASIGTETAKLRSSDEEHFILENESGAALSRDTAAESPRNVLVASDADIDRLVSGISMTLPNNQDDPAKSGYMAEAVDSLPSESLICDEILSESLLDDMDYYTDNTTCQNLIKFSGAKSVQDQCIADIAEPKENNSLAMLESSSSGVNDFEAGEIEGVSREASAVGCFPSSNHCVGKENPMEKKETEHGEGAEFKEHVLTCQDAAEHSFSLLEIASGSNLGAESDIDITGHSRSVEQNINEERVNDQRLILIHGTPKKPPLFTHDMKENHFGRKRMQMINATAVKPVKRRKALEKI